MILLRTVSGLKTWLQKQAEAGRNIGFVPTMGALHNGHIALVDRSVTENDLTVCSIFINPTQFNNSTDFQKYPVTIEKDLDMLEAAGCSAVFLPSTEEIYPAGPPTEHYPLGYLETVLEGKYRPGHFQGVCQVVKRLLEAVMPDHLYLGQKDYQQCMVIRKLIELQGWNDWVKLLICPTIRESDGLAMSSRNMRLGPEERRQAVQISATLNMIKEELKPGELSPLKQKAIDQLTAMGFKVDYVEIADAGNLQLVEDWDGKTELVALIAAFIGEVRLIDNMVLG